ncbi:uncharacterized protein LOC110243919 [Exaiptasia diaphana]|uniref:Helicase ATP-binding domain-containing protein n=1 Tax=Exaiptasia diaphana TaxID=2652724 RepID=A0A913XKG3_EXADI|nr:uncharacterized protein LOC110243919 [Exaiptasia diaphana]
MMADALEEDFEDLYSTVLTNAGLKFALKDEQKQAIKNLYCRRDVLAILPTGFGKSLIFQILVLLQSEALKRKFATTRFATILVISPLRSLIEDQLEEVRDLGISATSLPEASLEEIKEGKWKLVYSSPECALQENFLEVLKVGAFHDNMAAVVIDESHTIETWTVRRKASGNDKIFRKAFGELAKLRSFCKEGCS